MGFWCARYQFLHFWAPLLASRDPVGIQSGSSRAPMSGGSQIHKKTAFLQCFCMFLGDFGCFPTGPNVVPKIRKLVPDWIPTGQKRCPKMQKLVPDWVPTGSRLGPDWVPTGSRPGFFKKSPSSLNLSTYFWNFSTLYTVYILIIDYYYCYSFFVY